MSAVGHEEGFDEREAPAQAKRVFLIVSVFGFLLVFLLDVLSWFTERGGIFSIASALASVASRLPVVDIDEDGLSLPFMVVGWLLTFGFCRLFGIQPDVSSRRAKALLPIGMIFGGALVLNIAFGESIITRYMTANGYSRCEAGDWAQGNGKSRVWFADYVAHGVECRQRSQTVPERTLFK